MPLRVLLSTSSLLAVACLPLLALAQTPATVQPGQIERQFQTPPQPRSRAGEFRVPLPTQEPPSNADSVKFVLRELSVEGVNAYPEAAFQELYQSLLGREVSLAEIYAVANALTVRYRNDGYILSQVIVPAQSVQDGKVRLQAVEGYVADVRTEGDAPSAVTQAYADKIARTRPLTASALERYLLLMNDVPGGFARATLVPSAAQQGASDLLLQLAQRRFSGGLSVDNRGGRTLGPVRVSADVEQDGALGRADRSGLRLVSTFDRKLDYLYLFHEQALGSEGARIGATVSAVRSRPDTSDSFIALDLETTSNAGSIGLSYPVRRGRSENLSVRAAFTAHNGATELFNVRDTQDRIRALRLGMTYDLADAWRGVNIVDVELGHGLRGLGASRSGDPDLSRVTGKPDFSKLSLYAARLQSVTPQWAVLVALNAQYAFSDLLAPELFSVGGEQFGRGYDPSELSGDHGAALKLELRYLTGLQVGPITGATTYAFYDAGTVRQRSAGGLAASDSATSAGAGLRFDAGPYFSGYAEIAKPLTRDVAAEGNRSVRGYAGLAVRF